MAHVLLLHSAFGLRPAVKETATLLQADGHDVRVPDLFDGACPNTIPEAIKARERIGKEALIQRAREAAAGWYSYAAVGFSMGAATAQRLAAVDNRVAALLLLHGTGEVTRPFKKPVQLHIADPDPFEQREWLEEWEGKMREGGTKLTIYRYPEVGHLFTHPDMDGYDAAAASAAVARVRAFLLNCPHS